MLLLNLRLKLLWNIGLKSSLTIPIRSYNVDILVTEIIWLLKLNCRCDYCACRILWCVIVRCVIICSLTNSLVILGLRRFLTLLDDLELENVLASQAIHCLVSNAPLIRSLSIWRCTSLWLILHLLTLFNPRLSLKISLVWPDCSLFLEVLLVLVPGFWVLWHFALVHLLWLTKWRELRRLQLFHWVKISWRLLQLLNMSMSVSISLFLRLIVHKRLGIRLLLFLLVDSSRLSKRCVTLQDNDLWMLQVLLLRIILFELVLNHNLDHADRVLCILKTFFHRFPITGGEHASHHLLVWFCTGVSMVALDLQRVVEEDGLVSLCNQLPLSRIDSLDLLLV